MLYSYKFNGILLFFVAVFCLYIVAVFVIANEKEREREKQTQKNH